MKRVIWSVQLSLSIKNKFLKKYHVILICGIFSGSFLDNLELLFFIKLWWKKKIFFLQMHNTILQSKIISKCKDDKPWKN